MMAIGEIEPRAAAGHEHAGRCAKAAQPLHSNRAIGGQLVGEPRYLAPVRIGGTRIPSRQFGAIGGAEHIGAGEVRPHNPRAIGRPQPRRQGACRVRRQPRIAFDLPLELLVHRREVARAGLGFAPAEGLRKLTNR